MSGLRFARIVRSLLCPEVAARYIVKRFSFGSLNFRLSLQALETPQYAFGVKQAVYLAKKLKHSTVSVIEFGVANGEGLLTLEKYATEIGKLSGVEVEVYGFDLGTGLPPPMDHRDLPYVWQRGQYQMDEVGLKKKLKTAKLVLGDVGCEITNFIQSHHAPIGFISFDLDYYSSTSAALRLLLEAPDRGILPRIICYFDDVISDGHQLHCDRAGELLAIREFNQTTTGDAMLAATPIRDPSIMFPSNWMHQIWVYHRFNHYEYNRYIGV
jgi:hypothetical protein